MGERLFLFGQRHAARSGKRFVNINRAKAKSTTRDAMQNIARNDAKRQLSVNYYQCKAGQDVCFAGMEK
jgi:hypothetical protein